eukprot:TRINITY_DN9274_c0_g1_i2.p1 TRINITY_DN9274_c0_g1~~TRINITY_DN9274_c0_g1_i2.p1  ORF type:complete len:326 (-),score=80.20 TRINITY_DN9274_c0_g1_i2:886-1863(-)
MCIRDRYQRRVRGHPRHIMEALTPLLETWNTVAQGTVFMPVDQIDQALSALPAPVPLDVVKFMLTLIIAIPFGFLSRFVPLGSPRHFYNLMLGVMFAQGCYGPGWLHLIFSGSVSYLFLLVAPRSISHRLVFVWMMGYIGATHVYRMSTEWLGWSMDFSGPQMMATLKITSLAFNYHDGKAGRDEATRKKDLAQMQERMAVVSAEVKAGDNSNKKELFALRGEKLRTSLALDSLPGPLEYMGWVHNFSTYQAGPALEIQDYQAVNNRGVKADGCALATGKHFVFGIVFLVLHMKIDEHFPLGDPALGLKNPAGILSDSFLQLKYH